MTCNYSVQTSGAEPVELHIGHFVGPSGFTFEGHFRHGEPWLTTWQQWRAFLTECGGQIRDEYGQVVPLDEFVALVESTSVAGRRKQYDYITRHPHPYWDRRVGVQPRGDWLDSDGFSFYGGEFS